MTKCLVAAVTCTSAEPRRKPTPTKACTLWVKGRDLRGRTRLHSSLLQPSTYLTGPNMWTMRELSAVSNMPRLIPNTVTTASSEGKDVVWAFTALFAQ